MKLFVSILTKKWILSSIIVITLCITLAVTYARFFVTSDNHRVSEMYVTELTYKIIKDSTEITKLTVEPGENNIELVVNSNNNIDTKFKLGYKEDDNIEISYFKDQALPYGTITSNSNTNTIKLSIDNKSLNNIDVELSVYGGYDFNNLSDITVPNGYKEINEEISKWYYTCDSNTDNLNCKMVKADTPHSDTEASEHVTSVNGIDFAKISDNTNGKGLYYTSGTQTEDGRRVYYYRGVVTNNYAMFAGHCWRIIRTNENGGVRLRYDGGLVNGKCIQTGNTASIDTIEFSSAAKNNAGMGYMYGTAGSSSYKEEHANINESNAKQTLDNWYKTNIESNETYKSKVDNVIYCNDRSLATRDKIGNTSNTKKGYAANITFYGFTERVVATDSWSPLSGGKPTFRCPQVNDSFTLSEASGGTSGYGNNMLKYPIGLLTGDEGVFAGGVRYTSTNSATQNNSYYLYTGEWYLTMTPAFFTSKLMVKQANMVQVRNNGSLDFDSVFGKEGAIYPVISLKPTIKVTGGTGIYTDPYILE